MTRVLLFLMCCTVMHAQREAVVWSANYMEEVHKLDVENFSTDRLREIAVDFGRKYSSSVFGRLLINPEPLGNRYPSKGGTHLNLDNYFYRLGFEFPEGISTWKHLAMVLKVGDWVILRIRDGERVQEVTIARPNSSVPGEEFGYEILDIAPLYDPPRVVGGVEVFAKAGRDLEQKQVDAFAREVRSLLPKFTFHVFVRKDTWFIEQPLFPFIYAFDEVDGIPTRDEYMRRKELGAILRPAR